MSRSPRRAFSLLELVLVLALLVSATALLAPSLGQFFRGRGLDDEARRLWALTRYAQEQAISQALPVAVWVDPSAGAYGLEAEPGYGYTVPALRYELPAEVEIRRVETDVESPAAATLRLIWWPDGALDQDGAVTWQVRHRRLAAEGAWELRRELPLSTFTLVKEGNG